MTMGSSNMQMGVGTMRIMTLKIALKTRVMLKNERIDMFKADFFPIKCQCDYKGLAFLTFLRQYSRQISVGLAENCSTLCTAILFK